MSDEVPAPPKVAASRRPLAIALVGLIVLQVATVLRVAPPAARDADAPATEFSAGRAFATLERLLGDQAPHPVGTPANDAVRERLMAELRALGCEPEVHDAWAWSQRGVGARVRNVLARLPGGPPSGPGRAVLLLCHYDSVPAGPGAADDGMGVAAVLEAARALRAGPPLARPVLIVVTDGEEVGLLGARAFEREHPWSKEVGAIVNLEARGTSGPSFMFQTTPGNAWMVPLLADGLPRPLCSSLFPSVYERLPNDTDLTVFLRADDPPPSFNFACIADVDHYHTPQDDLAHLSRDTLQHHGESALGLARALAAMPLEELRGAQERAVYFDVLALFVVRWPEPWSVALGVLALAGVVVTGALAIRRGEARPREVLWAALLVIVALCATAALALLGTRALAALTGGVSPWAASPVARQVGSWALAWMLGGAAAALALARAGAWGAWAGAWSAWSSLGIAFAAGLPGGCFLLVAPALVAAALGLLAAARPRPALRALAMVAPALVAATLWLPIARGLDWAFGLQEQLPVAVAALFVVLPLAPLLPASGRARWALPAASALVGLGALVVVLASGPHDASRPLRVNVVLEEDADAGSARWRIESRMGAAPTELLQAAGIAAGALEGPAPLERLAPPELVLLEGTRTPEGRRLRCRARSPRGAWAIRLRFDPPVTAATIDGQRHARAGGLASLDLLGAGPEGLEVLLEVAADAVDVTLEDASLGLPASGAAILAARPAWATRTQQGDLTLCRRRLRF